MFTGIVERTARIVAIQVGTGGKRLALEALDGPGWPAWEVVVAGESIAVNGVCLTAVDATGRRVEFDVVPETLTRTTLAGLTVGDRVNIERSLRAGDRFGGHYVTGHIDGTGRLVERRVEGDQTLFRIAAPARLIGEMLPKGSIAVDGISLTLIEVERAAGWFSFAAIPHTLERTNLAGLAAGDGVNLETDAFGKWVLQGMAALRAAGGGAT